MRPANPCTVLEYLEDLQEDLGGESLHRDPENEAAEDAKKLTTHKKMATKKATKDKKMAKKAKEDNKGLEVEESLEGGSQDGESHANRPQAAEVKYKKQAASRKLKTKKKKLATKTATENMAAKKYEEDDEEPESKHGDSEVEGQEAYMNEGCLADRPKTEGNNKGEAEGQEAYMHEEWPTNRPKTQEKNKQGDNKANVLETCLSKFLAKYYKKKHLESHNKDGTKNLQFKTWYEKEILDLVEQMEQAANPDGIHRADRRDANQRYVKKLLENLEKELEDL